MSEVFTHYLRSLRAEGEPDPESLARVWQALREVLGVEIRRRGLWQSSPSFLGVFGQDRWQRTESAEPTAAPAGRAPDALDELAADCYTFIFIQRLQCLRAQLRIKENVDGLVFRNIRNFLHDAQRSHDPLGYRVFVIAHHAISELLDAGRLHLLRGNPKIRNDSVFGFGSRTESAQAAPSGLREQVAAWNDELFPDLVTARGRERGAVVARLQNLLAELPRSGVEAFSFKELADALKHDARARWAAWWQIAQGETAFEDRGGELAEVVRVLDPDSGFEDRDSFRQLVACVESRLRKVRAQRRTRDHLAKLWRFLQAFAAERLATPIEDSEDEPGAPSPPDKLPSHRRLARLLGIPRDRFRDLYATLRAELEHCRQAAAGASRAGAWRSIAASPADTEARSMNLYDLHKALARRTSEALSENLALEAEVSRRGVEPPRRGDVFLFEETAARAISWVVIGRSEEARHWLVVPADVMPLIGSADVAVPAEADVGPLSLRCGFATWLPAACFDPHRRLGTIDQWLVARATEKQRAYATGSPVDPAAVSETDVDPTYVEWCDELDAAREVLAERAEEEDPATGFPEDDAAFKMSVGLAEVADPATGTPEISAGSRRRAGFNPPLAIAASLLLMVSLALAGGWLSERRQTGELRRQLEALQREQINVPLVWLESRRDRAEPIDLALPAGAQGFFLVLSLPASDPPEARYRLEILPAGSNEVMWSGGPLRRVGVSEVTVMVRRESLPAGEYLLRLYRLEVADEAPRAYSLRLGFEEGDLP